MEKIKQIHRLCRGCRAGVEKVLLVTSKLQKKKGSLEEGMVFLKENFMLQLET